MNFFSFLIPFLVVSIGLSGCHSQTFISPNQLEYLNSENSQNNSVKVRTTNGELITFDKRKDLTVTLVNGKSYVFKHPYGFGQHLDSNTLRVYSRNHPDMYLSIDSIQSVSIETTSALGEAIYGFFYLLPFLPILPIALLVYIFEAPGSRKN